MEKHAPVNTQLIKTLDGLTFVFGAQYQQARLQKIFYYFNIDRPCAILSLAHLFYDIHCLLRKAKDISIGYIFSSISAPLLPFF